VSGRRPSCSRCDRAGAQRLSEIAGRLGRPATSLGHPLDRLTGMGFVRRETPYGELERIFEVTTEKAIRQLERCRP